MNATRYRPWPITAATTMPQPVFPFVNTTGQTIITQPGVQSCTPASMVGIAPFMFLLVYPTSNGIGTPEIVQVLNVSATSFTANFQNLHSGYYLVSQKPGELGKISVGTPGSNAILTLYNGAPALAGLYGSQGEVIETLTLADLTGGYTPSSGYLENTLFYTLACTVAPKVTLWYQARYF